MEPNWRPKSRSVRALARGDVYPAKIMQVIDGDSVQLEVQLEDGIALKEVRLFGIDAPEHNQSHGDDAHNALARLVRSHDEWRLEVKLSSDRYGRVVGLLYPAGSTSDQSVSRGLVQQGMAYWDPKFAQRGEHGIGQAELEARIGRRGLWQESSRDGDLRPWVHRKKEDEDDFISEHREQELDAANSKVAELERELTELRSQSDLWLLKEAALRQTVEHYRAERDDAKTRLNNTQETIREYRNSDNDSSYLLNIGYAVDSDGPKASSRMETEQIQKLKQDLQLARADATKLRNENMRLQAEYLAARTPWLVKVWRFLIGH